MNDNGKGIITYNFVVILVCECTEHHNVLKSIHGDGDGDDEREMVVVAGQMSE